ncbi:Processive diacylglycerol beta-glucosyltransferase [bioreactor metagenome]|uniref:Processive diacylglycerol beta-glucosyltransferase n=1 Tax=bioreactor metagenome TaxID=1076179 RepID=A0A645JAW2_9ZZZZ
MNPIPKQEINNSVYLQENGAGILARSAEEVGAIVSRLSGDRDALAEMRRRALRLAFPNAAERLVDAILGETVRTEGS